MKIVIALDKFKGSLTAPQACDIVRRALLTRYPAAEIITKPMADGGEGTLEALHAAGGGNWIEREVTGPLPCQRILARYLLRDRQAFIEMAKASGLLLVPPGDRNPLRTTTYGTGELIADALARGAEKIWLAVGGSATVDGGVGAAMALGWRFLDAQDQPVSFGGGELERIARLVPPTPPRVFPPLEVLCDVDTPLTGPQGAAAVFGPQKGATPAMVARLDTGLRHLAKLAGIEEIPGTGAAGGLPAGAMAFLGARLVPGIETIIEASGLAGAVAGADWVITGEGCFDEQSLRGKVVAGVTALARRHGAKIAVLAGRVDLPVAAWTQDLVVAITPPGTATEEALRQAEANLFNAVVAQASRLSPW